MTHFTHNRIRRQQFRIYAVFHWFSSSFLRACVRFDGGIKLISSKINITNIPFPLAFAWHKSLDFILQILVSNLMMSFKVNNSICFNELNYKIEKQLSAKFVKFFNHHLFIISLIVLIANNVSRLRVNLKNKSHLAEIHITSIRTSFRSKK